MMGEIAQGIWAGLAGASLLDRVNLALGIAGVVLMVRRSLWAFPVGLVAVTPGALRGRSPATET